MKAKVNIVSRHNARFHQEVSILWAHEFQSGRSVYTEFCGVSRNNRSARTRCWLEPLPDLKADFGSLTQDAFLLKTEAAFAALVAREACSEAARAAWAAWQACSEAT